MADPFTLTAGTPQAIMGTEPKDTLHSALTAAQHGSLTAGAGAGSVPSMLAHALGAVLPGRRSRFDLRRGGMDSMVLCRLYRRTAKGSLAPVRARAREIPRNHASVMPSLPLPRLAVRSCCLLTVPRSQGGAQ